MSANIEGLCPECSEAVRNTVQLVANLGKALVGDGSNIRDETARQIRAIILDRMEALAGSLETHGHHPDAAEVKRLAGSFKVNGGSARKELEQLQLLASYT